MSFDHPESPIFVQLALSKLKANQAELAKVLDVSPTQITKWKKGDYMSFEKQEELRELLGLPEGVFPSAVLSVGGVDNVSKWCSLVQFICTEITEEPESNYTTTPLNFDEEYQLGAFASTLIEQMVEAGVDLSTGFPDALDFDYEDEMPEDGPYEFPICKIKDTPEGSLIYDMLRAYEEVYAFYAAYMYEIISKLEDELGDYDRDSDFEVYAIELALSKVSDKHDICSNAAGHRVRVNEELGKWLEELKQAVYGSGNSFKVEIMDLITETSGSLEHDSEREAFGFNKRMGHPDVYMNELLINTRVNNAMLQAICKKLGVTSEEIGAFLSEAGMSE